MTVGKEAFSGKGAREEAARALVDAVISPRDDYTLRRRGRFNGFKILSKHQLSAPMPELFIRGAGTYAAHLNADNPTGTMQSIERALRGLDRLDKERVELRRFEKTLTDYQAQDSKPFEQQARLKEFAGAPGSAQRGPRSRQKRRPSRRTHLTLTLRRHLAIPR